MTGTAEPEPATSEEPASSPGLRAVLDANVVASALVNPAGVPGKIVMRLFAPVVQDDPDDDLYLAVATTGMAVYVVSGDRHLLGLRTYGGITIVPPRQFLQLLDKAL